MICIIAGAGDPRAGELKRSWGDLRVGVLTPSDFSRPGWRFDPARPRDGQAVVAGTPLPAADIDGVVTLLPAVFPDTLVRVVPAERAYAAAEIHALMRCWLLSLPCAVLNRPSGMCLCGPWWRPERWALAAASAGIPALPVARPAGAAERDTGDGTVEEVNVTVIGNRVLGTDDPMLAGFARTLGRLAGAELLTVRFDFPDSRPRFCHAVPWIETVSRESATAIRERLEATS